MHYLRDLRMSMNFQSLQQHHVPKTKQNGLGDRFSWTVPTTMATCVYPTKCLLNWWNSATLRMYKLSQKVRIMATYQLKVMSENQLQKDPWILRVSTQCMYVCIFCRDLLVFGHTLVCRGCLPLSPFFLWMPTLSIL